MGLGLGGLRFRAWRTNPVCASSLITRFRSLLVKHASCFPLGFSLFMWAQDHHAKCFSTMCNLWLCGIWLRDLGIFSLKTSLFYGFIL